MVDFMHRIVRDRSPTGSEDVVSLSRGHEMNILRNFVEGLVVAFTNKQVSRFANLFWGPSRRRAKIV